MDLHHNTKRHTSAHPKRNLLAVLLIVCLASFLTDTTASLLDSAMTVLV